MIHVYERSASVKVQRTIHIVYVHESSMGALRLSVIISHCWNTPIRLAPVEFARLPTPVLMGVASSPPASLSQQPATLFSWCIVVSMGCGLINHPYGNAIVTRQAYMLVCKPSTNHIPFTSVISLRQVSVIVNCTPVSADRLLIYIGYVHVSANAQFVALTSQC